MTDNVKKIEKKVYVLAGFTEVQRAKNLENASEKWKNKGWSIVKKFDGGFTKSSYLILEKQGNQEYSKVVFEEQSKKSIGVVLGIGILVMPIIFSWLTLRKGYTIKAKFISFAWLIFILMIFSTQDDNNKNSISQTPKQTESISSETKQKTISNEVKEPKKIEKFLDTRKNIQLVIESLDKNYGIKATTYLDQVHDQNKYLGNYCLNDKFCAVYADTVQIQAIGYTVDPLTSSQVAPTYYQKVCSAVLIALSGGANKELVEQMIVQHFNYAAQDGSVRSNVLGVGVDITPDYRGILGCSFVKKW